MLQSGWQEVSTLEQLESFARYVGAFHDGIIKEVHWVNHDSVNADLSMCTYQLAEARVLVQRQCENPSAVEMVFQDVLRLHLDTVEFIFDSEAGPEVAALNSDSGSNLLVLKMENSEIAFRSMKWRDASDWMGESVRFTSNL